MSWLGVSDCATCRHLRSSARMPTLVPPSRALGDLGGNQSHFSLRAAAAKTAPSLALIAQEIAGAVGPIPGIARAFPA